MPFSMFFLQEFFLLVYSKNISKVLTGDGNSSGSSGRAKENTYSFVWRKYWRKQIKTEIAEENGKNTEQNTYNFVWGIKRNLFVIFSSKFNNKNTLNLIWQFKSNKETFSFIKNITQYSQTNKQGNWNNCSPFETKINAQVQNIVKKKISCVFNGML